MSNVNRLWLSLILLVPALAQQRLDSSFLYHRIFAKVPMIGRGTWDDPKRPMFAPTSSEVSSRNRSGILAFQFQVSDDGAFALVEFVASNKTALEALLTSVDGRVKVFERGKNTRQEIETEFKKYKRDFSFDGFRHVGVQ